MKKIAHTILLATMVYALAPNAAKADETADLMKTILDASPQERANAAKYNKGTSRTAPTKQNKSTSATASAKKATAVPDMRIPESQLLEASSKFPNDYVGKYIYGPVSFKNIFQDGNDVCITFTAKGYRMFNLYTKDPQVIQAFSQCAWGTKFSISKECPLKIYGKDVMRYVVRLPFD